MAEADAHSHAHHQPLDALATNDEATKTDPRSRWTSTGKIKQPGRSLSPEQLVQWHKSSLIGVPKTNVSRQPGVTPPTQFQCGIIACFEFKVGSHHFPRIITKNEYTNKYHEKVLRIHPDLEATMPGLAEDCVVIVAKHRQGKKRPIVRDAIPF